MGMKTDPRESGSPFTIWPLTPSAGRSLSVTCSDGSVLKVEARLPPIQYLVDGRGPVDIFYVQHPKLVLRSPYGH
jgi:hypothetical protein